MDRIFQAIRQSKYSIHDLSRCRGEGDENLARFNMPLELGIAMAQHFDADVESLRHDWLLLVPKGHTYKRFASDLSGYDPAEHNEEPSGVISKVMAWLATRPDAVRAPRPAHVLAVLPKFTARMKKLDSDWNGAIPWPDVLIAGLDIAEDANLIPPKSG